MPVVGDKIPSMQLLTKFRLEQIVQRSQIELNVLCGSSPSIITVFLTFSFSPCLTNIYSVEGGAHTFE